MSNRLFTNNATTTLAAGITSAATALAVTSGTGSLFPAISAGQSFSATLIKAGTPGTYEIVLCTARAGDSFTAISRGQQGTTALAWNAGDTVALLPTAGDLAQMAQFIDLQAQLQNYAADTGTANAYAVSLFTAHVIGAPIRFLAAHTNTGNCTFNDGAGSGSLLLPGGAQVPAGTILAGGMYTCRWDGSEFQLLYPNLTAYALISQLGAYATTASLAAYALLASPSFTGYPNGPTAAAGTSTGELATTAFANPGFSHAINGYRKCPDGSIEQWGTIANGGAGNVAVTFPIPFPTACWNVVSQCVNVEGTIAQFSVTNTGFISLNGANGSSTMWRAVGY